ncbi:MAG: hypothetical protein OXU64_10680 [Gemmatimonadota bacterium]|nr:hypothetical protein [Gemmatimonadota bacterium]
MFDERTARRQLRHYRRKGPGKGTRELIDAVAEEGVEAAVPAPYLPGLPGVEVAPESSPQTGWRQDETCDGE